MTPRGRRHTGRRRPQGRQPQGRSRVGERLEVEVTDVAHGGHCVARHEGQVVFVRHALPGERVVAEVTSGTDRTSFLRADAVEVLTASPHRRPAPCAYAHPGGCGGCDWQHADVAYSRVLKGRVVAEQLRRLAGLDVEVEVLPVPGDTDGLRWRTRVDLAVDAAGRAGLRPFRSHDVIAVQDCLIATDAVDVPAVVAERWPEGTSGVDVAVSSTGERAVVPLPVPRAGRAELPVLHEQVRLPDDSTATYDVGARGFWQVHPGAAATLVERVLAGLDPQPGERVLDLYAGVGLFTLPLAERVGPQGHVDAVEGDAQAVASATRNLADLPQAEAVAADVETWLAEHEAPVDLVVLDPPRVGAGRAVMQTLTARSPRRVVYVACDPAALARDLRTASENGYRLVELTAHDLFPMTHHVECVAVLEQG